MDFLKKHYEKVLLGAVLLGLAGAVGFLFFKIASEREELQTKEAELARPKVTPLPELDMASYQAVLQRLAGSARLDLSSPHKLFNPMPWRRTADGRLVKIDAESIGPKALVVTKLNKLYLDITVDQINLEGPAPRFTIGIKREGAANPKDRVKPSSPPRRPMPSGASTATPPTSNTRPKTACSPAAAPIPLLRSSSMARATTLLPSTKTRSSSEPNPTRRSGPSHITAQISSHSHPLNRVCAPHTQPNP
jgi:hypothetical protein